MPLFLVRRSLLRGTPKASRNRCFCSSFVGRRLSPSCLIPNPPVLSDLLKESSVYPFVMTTIILLEQSKYSPGEYIVLLLCESSRHCQINSYPQHSSPKNSHENPELAGEIFSKTWHIEINFAENQPMRIGRLCINSEDNPNFGLNRWEPSTPVKMWTWREDQAMRSG